MSKDQVGANKPSIYLDHNATTAPDARVLELVPNWLEAWGNPSSIHWAGREPKRLVREARQRVASAIGANPLEIVFTSGGSEANNLAIKGAFAASSKRRVLVSAVEHPSVTKTVESLKSQGAQVEVLPVNINGEVDLESYQAKLSENVALVSVMIANNETGNVFPIKKMAKLAHQAGALFHTDAVQSAGKMLISVADLDVDLASFSGHKFYALKGAGFLYCKKGTQLQRQVDGGGQERHRRGGTENVLAIASLGLMCGTIRDESLIRHMGELRDRLEEQIVGRIKGVEVVGKKSRRLPNTTCLIIDGVDGESLLMNLDLRGIAVSTGAACSSGNPEPSPVLLAMGVTRKQAQSSLRISLGWYNTADEVDCFVQALVEVVDRLRKIKCENLAAEGTC